MNFDEMHNKASKCLEKLIVGLDWDVGFYESDFECEYTLFEEYLKKFCDIYGNFYMDNDCCYLFFKSLTSISQAIVECDAEYYEDDFSRSVELIIYYLGKLMYYDESLKDNIYEWLVDFCEEYEDDVLVTDYFETFKDGEKIFLSDENYVGYDDFSEMVMINRS